MLSYTRAHPGPVSQPTTIQSKDAPSSFATMRLRREELPHHSGEWNHALFPVGGPTQPQLSRLTPGHHISMEHRPRRNQQKSKSDINASHEHLFDRKNKKEKQIRKIANKKMRVEATFKWALLCSPVHRVPKNSFSPGKIDIFCFALFDDVSVFVASENKRKKRNGKMKQ